MRRFRSLILVIACGVCAQAQKGDFEVTQTLRLHKAANGVDGALQVLTDSRLSSELRNQMWGGRDWSFVLPQGDARRAAFERNPPRNAELRIVTDKNVVLRKVAVERPLARITEARVRNDKTSFLVAVDYSVGFGSYAGITTLLLDVVEGQFQWAEATNINTHGTERIRLPATLKSAWKLVPFQQNHDILWVYCRPATVQEAEGEFVVGYVRYRFDGKRWVKYERLQNGFWESDESFPTFSSFP